MGRAATDVTHAAFYLDGQELASRSIRGFWALDPCQNDGAGCVTGPSMVGGRLFRRRLASLDLRHREQLGTRSHLSRDPSVRRTGVCAHAERIAQFVGAKVHRANLPWRRRRRHALFGVWIPRAGCATGLIETLRAVVRDGRQLVRPARVARIRGVEAHRIHLGKHVRDRDVVSLPKLTRGAIVVVDRTEDAERCRRTNRRWAARDTDRFGHLGPAA